MPEPEAGKVNIYSKTPYNQSTIQLYGQTYAVDQTFSYESKNDSFMVLDGSIYVIADESVLRQIFDLQKAAGMNADGSSMLSMYQTEISFEYDGTKEEKLACAEALSKAMESGENTHTSYLESRTENEKRLLCIVRRSVLSGTVPWHHVPDGYGDDHFLQTDF